MDAWSWLFIGFLGMLAFGAFGGWVAFQKQRDPAEGAILGLLFGPFGVLVEALLPGCPPSTGTAPSRPKARPSRSTDDRAASDWLRAIADPETKDDTQARDGATS